MRPEKNSRRKIRDAFYGLIKLDSKDLVSPTTLARKIF
jgi:hypothetical protein